MYYHYCEDKLPVADPNTIIQSQLSLEKIKFRLLKDVNTVRCLIVFAHMKP